MESSGKPTSPAVSSGSAPGASQSEPPASAGNSGPSETSGKKIVSKNRHLSTDETVETSIAEKTSLKKRKTRKIDVQAELSGLNTTIHACFDCIRLGDIAGALAVADDFHKNSEAFDDNVLREDLRFFSEEEREKLQQFDVFFSALMTVNDFCSAEKSHHADQEYKESSMIDLVDLQKEHRDSIYGVVKSLIRAGNVRAALKIRQFLETEFPGLEVGSKLGVEQQRLSSEQLSEPGMLSESQRAELLELVPNLDALLEKEAAGLPEEFKCLPLASPLRQLGSELVKSHEKELDAAIKSIKAIYEELFKQKNADLKRLTKENQELTDLLGTAARISAQKGTAEYQLEQFQEQFLKPFQETASRHGQNTDRQLQALKEIRRSAAELEQHRASVQRFDELSQQNSALKARLQSMEQKLKEQDDMIDSHAVAESLNLTDTDELERELLEQKQRAQQSQLREQNLAREKAELSEQVTQLNNKVQQGTQMLQAANESESSSSALHKKNQELIVAQQQVISTLRQELGEPPESPGERDLPGSSQDNP